MNLQRMKQLAGIKLTEGVMAIPGIGTNSESDMQAAGTVGRNQDYAAYDASQQPATESKTLDELVRVGSNIDPKSGRVVPNNEYGEQHLYRKTKGTQDSKTWRDSTASALQAARKNPANKGAKADQEGYTAMRSGQDALGNSRRFSDSPEVELSVHRRPSKESKTLDEKSTSEKQARTMAAAAHNPEFAKKVGIKQGVAKEFNKADTGTKQLSNAMKEEVKKSEIPAVQRKAAQPHGDWKVSTGDLKKENPTNKEWLANRAKEVGLTEQSFSNYSDVDAEIMNMLQSSSDAFGDQEETLVEISRYLLDQGLDNDEVRSIMDSIENYLHDEDMRDNMGGEQDDYDTDPREPDDYTSDGEALASAGHGSDEDYYSDPMDENNDGIIDKAKNDVGIDDLFDEVDEIVDDEDYDDTCRTCDGTGEGMYDGASCRSCGGSGVEKRERDPDDFDEPDDYFEPYDGPFEEAIDLNNGYGGTKADGQDYFPDGADGPVVKNAGPSGARYGDNPEQKKMQVAEVHKELVYGYRDYLKESSKK